MVATTSFSGRVKYELCHLRSRDNYFERPQRIASEALIMHKWTHRRNNQDSVSSAPQRRSTVMPLTTQLTWQQSALPKTRCSYLMSLLTPPIRQKCTIAAFLLDARQLPFFSTQGKSGSTIHHPSQSSPPKPHLLDMLICLNLGACALGKPLAYILCIF